MPSEVCLCPLRKQDAGENAPSLLGLCWPIPSDITQAKVMWVPTPYLLQPPVKPPGVLGCFRTMGVWPARVGPRGAIRAGDEMQHRGVAPVVIFETSAGEREKLALRPPTLQPEGLWIEAAAVTNETPWILRAKGTVQSIFESHLEPDHNALEELFLGRNVDQPGSVHRLRQCHKARGPLWITLQLFQ